MVWLHLSSWKSQQYKEVQPKNLEIVLLNLTSSRSEIASQEYYHIKNKRKKPKLTQEKKKKKTQNPSNVVLQHHDSFRYNRAD